MKKIMNFVLIVLCFFTFNIFVNAAAKENSAIQEIRNEKNRTDKEKLTVRKKDVNETPLGGEVSYYYKGNVLKKIVSTLYFETSNEYREYYIKNNRVYFIYEKEISTEHAIWTKKPKVLGIYETRYYFDFNGKIVRYVDENGKIHENDVDMRKADENLRKYKPNFLGNML